MHCVKRNASPAAVFPLPTAFCQITLQIRQKGRWSEGKN